MNGLLRTIGDKMEPDELADVAFDIMDIVVDNAGKDELGGLLVTAQRTLDDLDKITEEYKRRRKRMRLHVERIRSRIGQ